MTQWLYAPGHADGIGEYGLWAGGAPPSLRPHFHDGGQWTAVLAGRRVFRVGAEVVTVVAGQCLYIPAGVVHQSLDAGVAEVRCINAYAAGPDGDRPMLTDAAPIGAIAALAGISREHFSRRFRRLAGCAPQDFRIQQRLNQARARLKGHEPIAAIAADLGFADQSHLGRLFRQAFGVAPMAYRRMMA